MEEYNRRDVANLFNLIGKRNNNTPNFALFIGAGASACLGIKTASQMITEWRRQLYEHAKFDPDFADYREDPDFRKLVYETKE